MKSIMLVAGLGLVQAVLSQVSLYHGHYDVPGLGNGKSALLKAGGNTLDMAIAMVETEHMEADYPVGDGKTGDAASYGIFKQNWFMLRTGAAQFLGENEADSASGTVLNSNLTEDVKAHHDIVAHYGFDLWAAGQRNGGWGIKNPHTQDIQDYKSTVTWVKEQIESDPKYLTDNTRFWVGFLA